MSSLSRTAERQASPSRARRLAPPLLLAAAVAAVSVALHVRDPHRSGSWGYCPWLLLTGTYCPLCGGLRAVHDLTDGDVLAAASSNLLFIASLPVAAAAWVRAIAQRWTGVRRPLPSALTGRSALGAAAVVVVAFWVLRNLPPAAWLAP